MKKITITIFLLLPVLLMHAQNVKRPVNELINTSDPGWVLVKQWIDTAKNKVEVLPCDTAKARNALYETQVTTRSPMGAIVYMTGGILIDNGWIRILGSGSSKLDRSLPEWNKGKTFGVPAGQPGFFLIADDVVGGFFAMNGGALGADFGKIYYLAPDNLEWEATNLTYTDFLTFCFSGNLDQFYSDVRWTGWKEDVSKINGNQAFNFLPPLWMKGGKDLNKVSKRAISVEETYHLAMEMRKQLGIGGHEF